jgi:hypothetical protein
VCGASQPLAVERGRACEQLVEQDAQAVHVTARVDVEQRAHLGLLGAHVQRGADELAELGEQRLLRQPLAGRGFGDAEVDHLRDRAVAVVQRDEDVRGL